MTAMALRGTIAAGATLGALAWTATEYAAHRWVLHGPFGHGRLSRIPVGAIHRNHHRDTNHTVPVARATGHVAIAGVAAGIAYVAVRNLPRVNPAFAVAACAAWSAGYSTYDIVHHRLHHTAPRTEAGVHRRQRHFRHHFGAPKGNLGVTMSWWDHALNTEVAERHVTVPRALAPSWISELGPDFSSPAPATDRIGSAAVNV